MNGYMHQLLKELFLSVTFDIDRVCPDLRAAMMAVEHGDNEAPLISIKLVRWRIVSYNDILEKLVNPASNES